MAQNVHELIQKLWPVVAPQPLIRVGSPHDGGYLIPDDLRNVWYCFSPGVGDKVDFEVALADRGIHSFMVDSYESAPPVQLPEFTFEKRTLVGTQTTHAELTLDAWKLYHLPFYADDLILEMDIEGAEYDVIPHVSDRLLNQFRICVIEFHGLDGLLNRDSFGVLNASFERMLKYFNVVHIHPNNFVGCTSYDGLCVPQIMEFTFLNKRRFPSVPAYATAFQHPLDADNNPTMPHMALPRCWYDSRRLG
jgi:hypothetical protein